MADHIHTWQHKPTSALANPATGLTIRVKVSLLTGIHHLMAPALPVVTPRWCWSGSGCADPLGPPGTAPGPAAGRSVCSGCWCPVWWCRWAPRSPPPCRQTEISSLPLKCLKIGYRQLFMWRVISISLKSILSIQLFIMKWHQCKANKRPWPWTYKWWVFPTWQTYCSSLFRFA